MSRDLPPEPMHQPPDHRDLEAFPPATPTCALTRGRLRDFADGDLEAGLVAEVEAHVASCRACGLALARAEHEVLRLRRAFGRVALEEAGGGLPRVGFAQRVVQRLVLDETSFVSREVLAALVPAGTVSAGSVSAGSLSAGSAVSAPAGVPARGARRWFAALALAGSFLVLLAVGYGWLRNDDAPHRNARLVITQADDAFGDFGLRLARGDGLGEAQTLWVSAGGQARFDWHDAQARSQPAATLAVDGNGKVKMQDGEPVLLQGTLSVDAERPVSIPIADGSRIDLSAGEYRIRVQELAGRDPGERDLAGHEQAAAEQANLHLDPARLGAEALRRIEVEVLRGEGATILRPAVGPTLVAAGQTGIYQGDAPTAVQSSPGSAVVSDVGDGLRRRDPVTPPVALAQMLRGNVFERTGAQAIGADVLVSFASRGVARSSGATVAGNGEFAISTGPVGSQFVCDLPFAIAQVVPPANRPELGLTVPEPIALLYAGNDVRLALPPVLDVSLPLVGTVVDELGAAVGSARVLPCVVDELFGPVMFWAEGQATVGTDGRFRLTRLPVGLPAHQHLAVLVLHPAFAPLLAPVPGRGSIAARTEAPRFEMQRLHDIVLAGLPGSTTLQVYEDVRGLPAGLAAVRRSVTTDGVGRAALAVGGGSLWLRNQSPTHPMVRALQPTDSGVEGEYRPVGGSPLAFDAVYRPLAAIAGTELFVASAFRFQRFSTAVGGAPQGVRLQALDQVTKRAIVGAQVFAARSTALRSPEGGRFVGFTSNSGKLSVELEPGENHLMVVAGNGAFGWTDAAANGDEVELLVASTGSVLVGARLRPEASGTDVLKVTFEAVGATGANLFPAARVVRFTTESEGWEVHGLVPGEYQVTVGEYTSALVVSPASRAVLE